MEESYIYDTSRSCSGLLDFGIKELCKNIGESVYGEVQDTIMVFCQSRNNNLEIFESGSVGLVIHFAKDSLAASLWVFLEKIILKECDKE